MNKYKINVYAISKNEEKHVKRWVESMSEADGIYVLDTGSTDNTVEELRKLGVNVKTKNFDVFRFDEARNESLKLLPEDTDICVCTDIDEVFNVGWRKKIESEWSENQTLGRYILNASLDENGKPLVSFYINKIHTLKDYKWIYPVHEVLEFVGEKEKPGELSITLNHIPDNSKSRGQYLKLLELAYKEQPENDRVLHYLGREYMYYERWNDAIDMLIKHLNLPNSVWKEERCASMRFISRCYVNLKRVEEARMWLNKAILEAPHLRDSYVELSYLEYTEKNYNKAKELMLKALSIESNPKTYINESFSYNYFVYDILSICEYYLGNKKDAIIYLKKAIKMEPNIKRLKDNLKIMESQENS